MVSWSDLSSAIRTNPRATFCVPHMSLRVDTCDIPNTVSSAVATVHVALPAHKPVSSPKPKAPVVESERPTNVIRLEDEPAMRPASIPRSSKHCIDPIVLGIEHTDPLYLSAPRLTKHQMDIAEAQRLEAMMNEVYTKESGRSRGWTKAGLETMIKARCASGGDIKELERARVSFPWKLIRDDKLASAFMDFVCVCKQIRVAVWDTDAKIVALYPAADPTCAKKETYPLYHVNTQGEQMFGSQDLVKLCDSNKYVLMPPLSVLKSLSGLTLDELAHVATQLGMTGVEGNKAERVAAIASFKVRSRLSARA
jgi:hypothetical protein